ncbi:hypothetical protein JAAARDRAFT_82576, partial [Jaapia argillacea MUCL 33604]
IILGTDWLHEHNPEVEWQDYNLKFTHCPNTCQIKGPGIEPFLTEPYTPLMEQGKEAIPACKINRVRVRAHGNKSIELAKREAKGQKEKTFEEMVPPEYRKYQKVFKKKASERFPK